MNLNLFDIDFSEKMCALLKESFKFKKYKAMNPALAVFTGIFMIPFVLMSFFATAWLAILSFSYSVTSSPAKFLHNIINNEGKETKHATQTAIYLISWPFVFFLYALLAFMLICIIPAYAVLAILNYVWTLGGFKFHILINKSDDIAIEVNERYFGRPLTFVLVNAIVAFISMIVSIVGLVDINAFFACLLVLIFFAVMQLSFCFLFSIIAYSIKGKKVAAPEAPVAAPVAAPAAPEAPQAPEQF